MSISNYLCFLICQMLVITIVSQETTVERKKTSGKDEQAKNADKMPPLCNC